MHHPTNVPNFHSSGINQSHVVEAIASRVLLVNTAEPRAVRCHNHLCQARRTTTVVSTSPPVRPHTSALHPGRRTHAGRTHPGFFLDAVKVDPDNILPDIIRNQFHEVLQTQDKVFYPTIVGYNGTAGPVQASVNMGPVQFPQRKGHVPQYCHDKLVKLQQKFDKLQ